MQFPAATTRFICVQHLNDFLEGIARSCWKTIGARKTFLGKTTSTDVSVAEIYLGASLFGTLQVVSRIMSLGSTTVSAPFESAPERRMRRSRVSAAILPISRSGWRTVVRAGFW